jgi:hypothetical protein
MASSNSTLNGVTSFDRLVQALHSRFIVSHSPARLMVARSRVEAWLHVGHAR